MGPTDFPNSKYYLNKKKIKKILSSVFRERMGLTEAEAVGKMWSGVKAMIQVNEF